MLPGTTDADTPFWSPDGKSVAFIADGKVKRLDLATGGPLVLCDANTNEQRGEASGTWNGAGVILFGNSQGLMRVAASGGIPVAVTRLAPPEEAHLYPEFLPDGDHFSTWSAGAIRRRRHLRLFTDSSRGTRSGDVLDL